MRDPNVFGPPEEGTREDGQDVELALELEPLPGRHAENQYGSALRDIQNSDIVKCSFQGLLPKRTMPLRRLSLELNIFVKDHPEYISIAPIEDNLCSLLGSIEGPPGTPYEGGIFFIRIDCPDNYPVKPPICNFITKIYHPNISQGRICVNILEEAWCPALTLQTILLSICSMLSGPFFESPLDEKVAAVFNMDRALYESNARQWTQKHATGNRPTDEQLDVAGEVNKRLAVALEKARNARNRWDENDSAGAERLW